MSSYQKGYKIKTFGTQENSFLACPLIFQVKLKSCELTVGNYRIAAPLAFPPSTDCKLFCLFIAILYTTSLTRDTGI